MSPDHGVTHEDIARWTGWSDSYASLYPGHNEGNADGEPMFGSPEAFNDFVSLAIGFYESLPDKFPVYRAVHAPGANAIDLEDSGESWSIELSAAVEFGAHNGSNFVISGTALKSGVDPRATIKNFVQFSGGLGSDSEFEVVIPNDRQNVINKQVMPMRAAKASLTGRS